MIPSIHGLESGFGTELICSFVIILVSLMIYFSTKELYELSSYKGIKYFRSAFLFFAIAYFFRSFIKFLMFYLRVGDMRSMHPNPLMGIVTLLVFLYFNAMAVFYLVQSVLYKKLHNKSMPLFHVLALIFSLSVLLFMSPLIILAINAILLIFVFVTYYFAHKESKKKNNLSVVYGLLSIFWTANFIDILVPSLFQEFHLLIYMTSIAVFLAILYKVLRKIGAN